ncbi:Phospholipid:diacylglycerol acyltransferase [Ascobolus immersus RN42]|uniref:Phospholipid:diacylglycerol acyltransferase n=1 Tax=Ascobolus immersus RN42 TaxID=1160509 RepID=A0A3N4I195_ASCIM|nr:Phospholipid:diacylglycerol acyltransferase [Ascobolus immersus RN42]
MSFLARRRNGGQSASPPTVERASTMPERYPTRPRAGSETPSISSVASEALGPEVDLTPGTTYQKVKTRVVKARPSKRRSWMIFSIGGLFGVILAGLAYRNQDLMSLDVLGDISLDSILDVLPPGIIKEASDIRKREKEAVGSDAFAVGLALKAEGLHADSPVIMVPGVISTGLESWGTDMPGRKWFRRRLWGSWHMLRTMVTDQAQWKRHVMLDKITGLDPPGVKLRAAQGFDATDFFITGYWIWNKIIENLATIGYDPTNSLTAAYDWRLSYGNLEVRDQYFTKLKMHIEAYVRTSGKKITLVSHSMGSQVVFYFFKWVEAEGHGNGGSRWVEDHVGSFINISGCMLGASKGIPALLSGEMKDTAQLNQFAVYGLEKFFSREDRAEILRAMPGISSMLPKGGDAVWGNETWAPDDEEDQKTTYGAFGQITVNTDDKLPKKNLTVGGSIDYMLESSEEWFRNMIVRNYSHGVAHTEEEVEANEKKPEKWVNPLETRLPYAPSLKIYCFYGIGKPTERSYYFRSPEDPNSKLDIVIDTAINTDIGTNPQTDRGVVMGEGDGTITLLSAGYMCTKGWKFKRYNPANIKVKTYEMLHEPYRFDIRGGPNTGDHVDILGRQSLNEMVLRVAAGRGDDIKETVISRIREIGEKVKITGEVWEDQMADSVNAPDGKTKDDVAQEDEESSDEEMEEKLREQDERSETMIGEDMEGKSQEQKEEDYKKNERVRRKELLEEADKQSIRDAEDMKKTA